MQVKRNKYDIWDSFTTHIKVDKSILSSLKNLFYGNNLYIFMSPFDNLVNLPIFNPMSMIKTDRTYNFLKLEIPCDIVDRLTGTKLSNSALPDKLNDISMKFICGKITEQEESELSEKENPISIDNDLKLDSN